MLLQVDIELIAIVKADEMRAVGVQLADCARKPRRSRIAAELNLDALANMLHRNEIPVFGTEVRRSLSDVRARARRASRREAGAVSCASHSA